MKHFFLFVSLFFLSQVALGQEKAVENTRPKVGLVLSGGGAKGLAHIGVLKVIDSLGIKVDYIGGTSMGAVVGGLYASGYTANQLDSIFSKIDVDALLQDYTPRESKSFYEKRNDEIYALTLPFNNFKLGLPSGLSKGLYNFNLMSRLTQHVSDVRDFDKLPIPFLCIATDVETGEQIVLDEGILAQAIIASGALPTLYSPVEINGRLLIDGGVVNNYPIEELKNRGIDFIIGIDVQDGLKNREQLKDVTAVLSQINNFSMIEKMEGKRSLTNIYIKPDIKGFSVVSFDKGQEIIKKGNEKANEFIKELLPLRNIDERPTTFKVIKNDSIFIRDITFNKLENFTRAYVLGKLKIKRNTKIPMTQIEKGISNLNATQNFSAISYSFEKTQSGERLALNLKENKSNTFLKFGIHYDDLYKSGALINYTHKKLIAKNDVASLDVILGDNFRYNFDYYIDNGFYWSFGFNSKFNSFNRNIATDFANGIIFTDLGINSVNIDFTDITNQAYVQTIFAQKFSFGAGLEFKYLNIKSETLENSTPIFDKSNYLSAFGYLKYDSFNQKYFPKKGWSFSGDLKTFLYSSDYTNLFERFSIARADAGIVFEPIKRTTIKLQTEGGFAIGERTISFFDFVLGGYGFVSVNNIKPFMGYDFLSLAGDSYVKGTITADYEIYKKHHINFTANFANVGNRIFEHTEDWLSKPKYTGYGIGYGMESIIGPLEIKHSWSPETKDHHTWFSVGFWF
ncbi:patatin-like phospholipase family protein [Flavobacterium sp. HXWNR29]|uniref:patatin-like phospholipase family protein n=1 Tax=Flavobacterium odoriferum TaxID=2946604 RepID=UPI0021CB1210|nr:patatin-like phospholipase family protein [Flavobacterium sp. HXWNR29]MCU4188035.1 patatin-like phospholipase family protein [Flavobacterium sp. HXWNR29]